jgi:hypothetical protein
VKALVQAVKYLRRLRLPLGSCLYVALRRRYISYRHLPIIQVDDNLDNNFLLILQENYIIFRNLSKVQAKGIFS